MLNYCHIPLDNTDESTIEEVISGIDNLDCTLVGSVVHEAHDWSSVEKQQFSPFTRVAEQHGFNNCIAIVNNTYLDRNYRIQSLPVIPLEFFALNTVYRIKELKIDVNLKWNPDSDKILFLTGKANKPNRVGLLTCLLNSGLKNNLEWSFFPFLGTYVEKESLEFFRWFEKRKSYTSWAKKHSKNPDNIKLKINENGSHYSGFPFNKDLFSNTCLSIIAESEFTSNGFIWLTEKTWKTIANRHPFIMAGQINTLKRLKELGFKTFENYLQIKNYDFIKDPVKRIEAVTKNSIYFLNNYKRFKNDIQNDVNYNYNHLMQLYNDTMEEHSMFQDKKFYNDFFRDTSIK